MEFAVEVKMCGLILRLHEIYDLVKTDIKVALVASRIMYNG